MKKKISIVLMGIAFLMLTFVNTGRDATAAPMRADWMTGATMSVVWVFQGIPGALGRYNCCAHSDPDNACNKDSQGNSSCDGWRDSDWFILTFPDRT
ncbi:hypothetical protein [Roseivirga sp. E12]|uniref:hypothetical protein n=1 Tax=Roseivirga sp. E12 TaxID=2819237 RepID=UPI001ABC7313|nr:hypothetical protein [Roseivirga sp. E12]MBO3700318.1 hypothetical protein [Roseivirga sp. E12]